MVTVVTVKNYELVKICKLGGCAMVGIRARKKGIRSGENHPGATMTDLEVEMVRQLHETEGFTYEKIAQMMECAKSTVAGICQYRRRGLRKGK